MIIYASIQYGPYYAIIERFAPTRFRPISRFVEKIKTFLLKRLASSPIYGVRTVRTPTITRELNFSRGNINYVVVFIE